MSHPRVSSKGQITLPAPMRRKLGIEAHSQVEIILREDEIVVRPLRPISELRGVFRHCVKDSPMDWEAVRTATERAVGEQVAHE